ncbi:MAG: diguanylate cyclase [Actinomycetota bacterium]|nr:diguanylate cyclase [Actinomycetota bacterium]
MTSDWIVVVEATTDGSAAAIDEATLSRLMEAVSDTRPIALHSADRYAVQLSVTAAEPSEALASALERWSDAVSSLRAPAWEVVRADVMTSAELTLELEMEQRRAQTGSAPIADDADSMAAMAGAESSVLRSAERDLGSELRWRLMLQDARGGLILLSADGTVVFSVPAIGDLPFPEDGSPRALADVVHPDDAEVVRGAVASLRTGDAKTVAFVTRLPGERGWRWCNATARNMLGEPLVRGIAVSIEDVTRQKELEDRLATLARHDELTGLVNRAVFLDSLELALDRYADGSQAGVFFVDIDDFRGLVERVGPRVGDRLLVTIADRMRTDVRDGAIAARLGGDEFAVLCDNIAGSD